MSENQQYHTVAGCNFGGYIWASFKNSTVRNKAYFLVNYLLFYAVNYSMHVFMMTHDDVIGNQKFTCNASLRTLTN